MPAPSAVTIRVNVRTLMIVLALTVPPLLIDLFLVLDRSRSELTKTTGGYFETLAYSAASGVSRFLESKINEVSMLAASAPVRSAAETGAETHGTAQTDAAAAYEEINQIWETPKALPIVSKVAGHPASVYLREYLQLNPAFSRIMVTDANGVAVAASHKPLQYYYGGQRWWIYTFGDGRAGRVHVEDAKWDPVLMKNSAAVSAPILASDSTRVVGVIKAFLDLEAFTPFVANVQPPGTGDALLVKRDGVVLSARETERIMTQKVETMEVIAPLLANHVRGSSVVHLQGGRQSFVGYAGMAISRKFPEIDWAVLVSQDLEEVQAAIQTVNSRALGSAFLAILIVGAVAVYFTTHRPQTLTPMDQLHETGRK